MNFMIKKKNNRFVLFYKNAIVGSVQYNDFGISHGYTIQIDKKNATKEKIKKRHELLRLFENTAKQKYPYTENPFITALDFLFAKAELI